MRSAATDPVGAWVPSPFLLVTFGIAAGFWVVGDLTSTYLAISAGGVEANPFGRALLNQYGFAGATGVKLLTTALIGTHWLLTHSVLEWLSPTERATRRRYAAEFAHPVLLAMLGASLTVQNLHVYFLLR